MIPFLFVGSNNISYLCTRITKEPQPGSIKQKKEITP